MRTIVDRRTVLKGMGTAMALPWLQAMAPTSGKPAIRMVFFFTPNGMNMSAWRPKEAGPLKELPFTLTPLESVKDDIIVFTRLAHDKARAHGDGPGDHARSNASFLTGCQARKTNGKDISVGISIDQFAAQKIGNATRLPSLELGLERGAQSGNCDSGYSCAYSSNLSWGSATTPVPKEVNPRAVFERLFGDPNQVQAARDRARQAIYRRSVLDLVLEDAKTLRGNVGGVDQRKLDEFMESVREIEKQIQAMEREAEKIKLPPIEVPEGIPTEVPRYSKLMLDLLALAFQSDTTRISSFAFANDGSNRTFPFIGVSDGHHSLSHHGGKPETLDKIKKIDQFYVSQFAYFVKKVKEMREGEQTVLDRSMLVYGCAIGDGNRHNHDDLPVLFAGQGGGTIKTGRHIEYAKETPMTNLFLSMMERAGVAADQFGDSTGCLPDLA